MSDEQLRIIQAIGSVATPIVTVTLGILFLRRIEEVKSAVVKQSEFYEKWAGQFFDCGQRFLQTIERELALLAVISEAANHSDDHDKDISGVWRELYILHVSLIELELRIRRSVVFAPLSGRGVIAASHECTELVRTCVSERRGDADRIIGKVNDFNVAARRAHAEMLGLRTPDRAGLVLS